MSDIFEYIFKTKIKEYPGTNYRDWIHHWHGRWEQALDHAMEHYNIFFDKNYTWPEGFKPWAIKQMKNDWLSFREFCNKLEETAR